MLGAEWAAHLSVNLKFKPSAVFADPAYGNLSGLGDRPPNSAPLEFEWKNREGLIDNIGSVVEEFNMHRGLDCVKLFLTGPPAVGKSHFAAKLAKRYNLPHITVRSVVDEAAADSVLGPELSEQI